MKEDEIACGEYVNTYLELYVNEHRQVSPALIEEIMRYAFINGFIKGQLSELKRK